MSLLCLTLYLLLPVLELPGGRDKSAAFDGPFPAPRAAPGPQQALILYLFNEGDPNPDLFPAFQHKAPNACPAPCAALLPSSGGSLPSGRPAWSTPRLHTLLCPSVFESLRNALISSFNPPGEETVREGNLEICFVSFQCFAINFKTQKLRCCFTYRPSLRVFSILLMS